MINLYMIKQHRRSLLDHTHRPEINDPQIFQHTAHMHMISTSMYMVYTDM